MNNRKGEVDGGYLAEATSALTPTKSMKEDKDIDTYISEQPPVVGRILKTLRGAIKRAAPNALESFSYGMPAYKLSGKPVVYFAAYRHHIGVYATPRAHAKFTKELSKYKQGKGSVQFPMSEKLPLELIAKIVKFKVSEYSVNGKENKRILRK